MLNAPEDLFSMKGMIRQPKRRRRKESKSKSQNAPLSPFILAWQIGFYQCILSASPLARVIKFSDTTLLYTAFSKKENLYSE